MEDPFRTAFDNFKEIKMKKVEMFKENDFNDLHMSRLLVHDSPYFKILNFNFKPGQELPIHSHDIEGQLSIAVMEGEGLFLGKDGKDHFRRGG